MNNPVQAALMALKDWGVERSFDFGLVLGTGLGPVAELVQNPVTVPYAQIPGFPKGQVSGHSARVVAGTIGTARVFVMQGRAHYYEHGDPAIMRTPIETMAALGINNLILTNAAGSLLEDVPPGELSLITDHINLSGVNPLIGVSDDSRFVPMVDAYEPALRKALKQAAMTSHVTLREGVYQWFPGPSFETPAEIRASKMLGATLVGMSTVPEVILARRIGLRMAAISMVTNYGAGLFGGAPSHTETKSVAAEAGQKMKALLEQFFNMA
ncbi:MAG: purine-nucleoside phosphorylase [Alphaproteobacteria bacterium]